MESIYFKIKTAPVDYLKDAVTEWTCNESPLTLEPFRNLKEAREVFDYLVDREEQLWELAEIKSGRYLEITLYLGRTEVRRWTHNGAI